jgi:hypothetical protein
MSLLDRPAMQNRKHDRHYWTSHQWPIRFEEGIEVLIAAKQADCPFLFVAS